MDPELDVVLRQNLPNNKWTYKKFKHIKLHFEKDVIKTKTWNLVVGRTVHKAKIQVTGNVVSTFKTFLEKEGKATIRFKRPPIECLMMVTIPSESNKKQLKALIKTINDISDGKEWKEVASRRCNTHEKIKWETAWEKLNIPIKQECLFLTTLNLAGRGLTQLPRELGELPIIELQLDYNMLGQDAAKFWFWMYGSIRKSLKTLSLGYNKLTHLPEQIVACEGLQSLSLVGNDLRYLPPGLINPYSTLTQLSLNDNLNLFSLPSPITKTLTLLDISGCNGLSQHREIHKKFPCGWSGILLRNIAGAAVLKYRIPYGLHNIPWNVTRHLDRRVTCDVCLYEVPVARWQAYTLETRMPRQVIASSRTVYSVASLCFSCSTKLRRWKGIELNT